MNEHTSDSMRQESGSAMPTAEQNAQQIELGFAFEEPSFLKRRYGEVPFSGRDWLLLILSLIPASWLCFGDVVENDVWMIAYVPLFHLTVLLLALVAAGRPVRMNFCTALTLLIDAALIVLGIFHRNTFLSLVNFACIPILTAMAALSVSGVNRCSIFSFGGIREAFLRSLRGLFEYIPLPLAKLPQRSSCNNRQIAIAVLSLLICVPILCLVILLLISADEVFNSWFHRTLSGLTSGMDSLTISRLIMTLLFAMMLFSWLFMLRRPGHEIKAMPALSIPGVFPAILLPMLNVIYAIFVSIQFHNLFGGTETAAMTGGFAHYARSGFFQLTAVAAINLFLLVLARHARQNLWLKLMSALLIACTGVILVSAVWRMRLYISAYGLTVLRIMTLWGMAAIAALLVIAVIALLKPGFKAFSAGFLCLLVLWLGINAVDIDRMIAEYNVDRYLSGALEQIDEHYLRSLSPSAQPALSRLEGSDH